MNKKEVASLFTMATSAYYDNAPDLKKNPQIFEIWVERLADTDPNQALKNLRDHIDSSDFFPKIADIKRPREHDSGNPEIRWRNIEVTFQKYIAAGGKPDNFDWIKGEGKALALPGGLIETT